jgi:hypothetical protein
MDKQVTEKTGIYPIYNCGVSIISEAVTATNEQTGLARSLLGLALFR